MVKSAHYLPVCTKYSLKPLFLLPQMRLMSLLPCNSTSETLHTHKHVTYYSVVQFSTISVSLNSTSAAIAQQSASNTTPTPTDIGQLKMCPNVSKFELCRQRKRFVESLHQKKILFNTVPSVENQKMSLYTHKSTVDAVIVSLDLFYYSWSVKAALGFCIGHVLMLGIKAQSYNII